MKNTYSTKTKEITTTTSVAEFRCIGIGLALALGGLPLANEMMQGVVAAADNTSNDEDYENQVESLFQHVRDEHITEANDQQKMVVDILESMAKALPRQVVMAEHFRHTGQSEQSGFNA